MTLPADLPYTDASQTNCGRDNNYDDASTAHCLYYYDSGEDIIYQLDVTEAIDVTITMNPYTTTYGGVAIGYSCPPTDDCIAAAYGSAATPKVIGASPDCLHLEAGTYYIMVDTWSSPDCIPTFDLTIEVCELPTGACCIDGTCDSTTLEADCAGDWFIGETCPEFTGCPTGPCDGNYETGTASGNYSSAPVNGYYNYSRSVSLIKRSEIIGCSPDVIERLSVNVATSSTMDITNMQIWMMKTTATTAPTTWDVSAATSVYGPVTVQFSATGYMMFDITDFTWDSDNLLIMWQWNGTYSSSRPYFYYTPSFNYGQTYAASDTAFPTTLSTSANRVQYILGFPLLPIGACCFGETCEDDYTQVDCENASGEYMGDGSDCDPNPCVGACCQPDGSCDLTLEEDCTGTYHGDGTVCDPNPCPQPGDNCGNPLVVSLGLGDLPYTDTNTNCGRGDDHDDTSTAHCLSYYDSGEEIIYELTVTEAMDVTITLDPKGTTYPGVAIGLACPPTDDCIEGGYHSSSDPVVIGAYPACISLAPGTTYYLQVDTWSAPDCLPDFDLTIELCEPPTGACCVAGVCEATTTEDDCTTTYGGEWFEGEDCLDPNFVCPAPCTEDTITLILDTDGYGSETTWEIKDAGGAVMCSGGPYDNNTHYEELCCIGYADCYDVFIYDSYGDGGPDYDVQLNGGSLAMGTVSGYGGYIITLGNGCVGGCCVGTACTLETEADCLGMNGYYFGDNTDCEDTASAVSDGSFEGGTPNADWTEASVNFGTPLCDVASCGVGGGTGPWTGEWWCWFGGIANVVEDGSVEQTVIIPVGSNTLEFYLEIPVASGNGTDYMNVLIDGNNIFSVLESDTTLYPTYTLVSLDISLYADGGGHLLRFEGMTFGDILDAVTNFFVDDVSIAGEVTNPCACGDLNDDNLVDNDDYVLFVAAYGKCVGDPAYLITADYDSDGCITAVDYQAWVQCYRYVHVPVKVAPKKINMQPSGGVNTLDEGTLMTDPS